jgi:hypothetical protein
MTSKSETSSTTLRQYTSRQAKSKPKLRQAKAKQRLHRRIVAAGSSRRVEEGIDKVVFLQTALL